MECKIRKSRDTWSNRQVWPWSTKWSRGRAKRVLSREHIGHSKHPVPTTQEKTTHGHHQMINKEIRLFIFSTVEDRCCSVAKSCPTLCDPMDCSMPGFPVLHYLPEFPQTHVHWVDDAIQPSHLLLSSPDLNLSQHQGLFPNESALPIRWSQYWSFSFSISPPNEYSGLISLRTDWIDLLCSWDFINFPRSPQENACCVRMILEVQPQTNMSCESSVSHKQHLLLGSVSSIYCPGLSHQSDAQSPEVTWYQVRMTSLNLTPEFVFWW